MRQALSKRDSVTKRVDPLAEPVGHLLKLARIHVRRIHAPPRVHIVARPGKRHDPPAAKAGGPLPEQVRGAHVGWPLVQALDMERILSERLAVELEKLKPIRLAGFTGHALDGGGLPERLQGPLTVVRHRGPAIAIDPGAIDTVLACQLAQLRNQQFVHIGAEA